MKISLLKNDKSTYWDEVWLGLITFVSLIGGVLLIVFRPSFWFITGEFSMGIGIAAVLLSIMFIPCIIYRLKNNVLNESKGKK